MATHSSNLAWEIPRTEEPEGLQSLGPLKSQPWLSDQTTLSTRLTASYLLLQIFKWKHREVKQQVHSHTARKWREVSSALTSDPGGTWFCVMDGWLLLCGFILFYMTWDLTHMSSVIQSGDKPCIQTFLYIHLFSWAQVSLLLGQCDLEDRGDSLVPACDYMGGLGASFLLWVSFPVN